LSEVYYQKLSVTQGRPARDVRLVIGAVIIKHKLCLSGEETGCQIQENPYLQYIVGLPGYQMKPLRTLTGYCTATGDSIPMSNQNKAL
jgi:IS5 family transposase